MYGVVVIEKVMQFRDRVDAGQRLGAMLQQRMKQESPERLLVLALPRGGVPVGFEVALALNARLDVFVVRKLGAPGHEELAMGAIASGGVQVINAEVVEALRVTSTEIEEVASREAEELNRRERLYRGDWPLQPVEGESVILVDDGLATGYSMRAAVAAVRQQGPKLVMVAVPVGARATCEELGREADAVFCLRVPEEFVAVGQWYRDFAQTSDAEVRALLDRAARRFGENAA